MSRPMWADDPGLSTVRQRRARAEYVDRRLAAWFGGQDLDTAVDRLFGGGPAAVAAEGDEESANEAPRLLRTAATSANRRRLVSAPTFRSAGRSQPMVVSCRSDARRAQPRR